MCGGTDDAIDCCEDVLGLSPRVRGNHSGVADSVAGAGSIPACAGEPPDGDFQEAVVEVYPRVCGGTPR